ncbi:unnamed protein product [Linum trigynum]|uniref:Uncharacterized protein n=1 Tax=Linum trigynum TaxID=586398 RepID=A0AAV2FLC9_9ROSI
MRSTSLMLPSLSEIESLFTRAHQSRTVLPHVALVGHMDEEEVFFRTPRSPHHLHTSRLAYSQRTSQEGSMRLMRSGSSTKLRRRTP